VRSVITRDTAVGVLRESARDFHARGWMFGTSGNLSIATSTNPDRFVITASGRHKGELTTEDFVEIDLDSGEPAAANSPRPSAETRIHTEIYRRTSAGAVYHVHQVEAAISSRLDAAHGAVRWERLEMLKGIGLRSTDSATLPIVANDPDIPALADEVGRLIEDGLDVPGVLIDRHGVYTWGADADAARRHIEIWAYLFSYRVELARCRRK